MFLLLILIGLLLLWKVNRRSMTFFFTLLIIVSLIGNVFLKDAFRFETTDILHFVWIIIVLAFIVLPWKSYCGINNITCYNSRRLKTVTIILVIFFMIQLIGSAVLAYYVMTTIEDINKFKYVEGTTDFYYSLGINLTPYMFASLFYPMSYIMVPLHLYYFSKGEKWLSFWCLLSSLLSIVFGLTYFSRAHIIHYIFIYLSCYWLLKDTLSKRNIATIRRVMVIGASIILAYFVFVSISRFEDHQVNVRTAEVSDNAVVNSMFDYLVMWWPNSETLFERFNWTTFRGQIALQDTNRLLSMFGINAGVPGDVLLRMRETILGDYSGAFIGVGAYFLYDFGPFFSLLVLIVYAAIIHKLRPKKNTISVERLIIVTIIMLLPAFAIFYSTLNTIILALIFILPIYFYLRSGNTVISSSK